MCNIIVIIESKFLVNIYPQKFVKKSLLIVEPRIFNVNPSGTTRLVKIFYIDLFEFSKSLLDTNHLSIKFKFC